MLNPLFRGIVKNGKVMLYDAESYRLHLHNLEGDIELLIRRPKKEKTNPQLRYLFGVVYKIISEHTGMSIEEVDIAMKMMFALNRDTPIPTVKLKRNMTTLEVSGFTEEVKMWAASYLGVYVPNPNEVEAI